MEHRAQKEEYDMGFESIFASVGQAIIAFLLSFVESLISPFITGIFGEPAEDDGAIEELLNS